MAERHMIRIVNLPPEYTETDVTALVVSKLKNMEIEATYVGYDRELNLKFAYVIFNSLKYPSSMIIYCFEIHQINGYNLQVDFISLTSNYIKYLPHNLTTQQLHSNKSSISNGFYNPHINNARVRNNFPKPSIVQYQYLMRKENSIQERYVEKNASQESAKFNTINARDINIKSTLRKSEYNPTLERGLSNLNIRKIPSKENAAPWGIANPSDQLSDNSSRISKGGLSNLNKIVKVPNYDTLKAKRWERISHETTKTGLRENPLINDKKNAIVETAVVNTETRSKPSTSTTASVPDSRVKLDTERQSNLEDNFPIRPLRKSFRLSKDQNSYLASMKEIVAKPVDKVDSHSRTAIGGSSRQAPIMSHGPERKQRNTF